MHTLIWHGDVAAVQLLALHAQAAAVNDVGRGHAGGIANVAANASTWNEKEKKVL